MEDLNEILDNLEKLICNTRNDLEKHEDEVKEEVISNIEDIVSDFSDCDDLIDFCNDNLDVDIRYMTEYEFNSFIEDSDIDPWDLVDMDIDKSCEYFGHDIDGKFICTDDIEDFVSYKKIAEAIVNYEENFDSDAICAELDKLHNSEKIYNDFMEKAKEILRVKEPAKEGE